MTTGNITTYYYAGGQIIAEREATTLRYLYQDSLSSTSLMTDASGNSLGTVKYYPFGSVRAGSVPTDILFKGQRLDDTGLFYSRSGFYDSNIGGFINPHTQAKSSVNPQSFNSYVSSSPNLAVRSGVVRQPGALAPALTVPMQPSPAVGTPVDPPAVDDPGLSPYPGPTPDPGQNPITEEPPNGNAFTAAVNHVRSLPRQQKIGYTDKPGLWSKLWGINSGFAQFMFNSRRIIFDLVSVDDFNRSVTTKIYLRGGVILDNPITIYLIDKDDPLTLGIMAGINAGAFSVYPNIVFNVVDFYKKFYSVEYWENYFAHESWHLWEQYQSPGDWYIVYLAELLLPHDLRPSERRAQKYADDKYPY